MMYEEASQVANDAVCSIRTVASFCAEEKVMQLYEGKCRGPMKSGVRLGWVSGVGFGVSSFLLYCFYATSFYVGARLVDAGHITFQDVFQVSNYYVSLSLLPRVLEVLAGKYSFKRY
jgi:ATP-binding cassette subfamily B (MDR/TAP) protein 1